MNNPLYMLGKEVSSKIRTLLLEDVSNLKKIGIVPKLAAVLVGDDPAS